MAKDSSRTTAIVKQHLHHHMLFGRVSREIIPAHPKTRLELQMGLASMVR